MISELDWALFVREGCSLFARTHSSSKADSLIRDFLRARADAALDHSAPGK